MNGRAARALLVDLDGTLVDTFPDLRRCAVAALMAHGMPLRDASSRSLTTAASHGALALLQALSGPIVSEDVTETMLDLYEADPVRDSRLFPGVENWFTLGAFAVVTNKPRRFAERVVARFCPVGTVLVTPEDAGAAKPDPAPMLRALAQLDCPASEAVYVGDDRRDYDAAIAANLRFIGAGYGYGAPSLATLPADVPILHAPDELPQVFAVQ